MSHEPARSARPGIGGAAVYPASVACLLLERFGGARHEVLERAERVVRGGPARRQLAGGDETVETVRRLAVEVGRQRAELVDVGEDGVSGVGHVVGSRPGGEDARPTSRRPPRSRPGPAARRPRPAGRSPRPRRQRPPPSRRPAGTPRRARGRSPRGAGARPGSSHRSCGSTRPRPRTARCAPDPRRPAARRRSARRGARTRRSPSPRRSARSRRRRGARAACAARFAPRPGRSSARRAAAPARGCAGRRRGANR